MNIKNATDHVGRGAHLVLHIIFYVRNNIKIQININKIQYYYDM